MSWSRCLIASGSLWLALAAHASADDDPTAHDADPAPEALPGALDHDDEDAAEQDAPEQGAFVLRSPIGLDSARMPVLVDVFPSYSPRNPITAWGRGWDAPALAIRRVRPGGPPRFDATDSFASVWGSLQLTTPPATTLYPRGLKHRVRGEFRGDLLEVRTADGTTWTYDGTRYRTARGIERWELTAVVDVFGDRVKLAYTPEGNLARAAWTRQGLLAHEVRIEYSAVPPSAPPASVEVVAGTVRARTERVSRVTLANTHRDTGTVVVVARYEPRFDLPGRDWLLTSIVELRGAISHITSYQYGASWLTGTDRFPLKLVKAAGTLPTYSTGLGAVAGFQPHEHAIATSALAPIDADGDGVVDFMTRDGSWWLYDRATGGYVRSTYLDGPHPDCVDPDAPLPTAVRFGPGIDPPFLFRLVSKATGTFELTQCSLAGKLIARLRLPFARPPATCSNTPGPIAKRGLWPYSVADLDGDGAPDLAVADACRLLVWYGRLNGDALALGPLESIAVPGLDPAVRSAILDVNGDGLLDVLDYGLVNRIWLNLGGLARAPAGAARPLFTDPIAMPLHLTGAATAGTCGRYPMHLDGDRFLDLMIACQLLDPVGGAPGTAPFRFLLFRGSLRGFDQIRELREEHWMWGWPVALPVSDFPEPGIAFVDLLAKQRASAAELCPEGSARGTTQGDRGPVHWCSPQVNWAAITRADADLLTRVDTGGGDVTDYRYAWATFPSGFGRGPAVLAAKTHRVAGRSPLETTYRYDDAWFEGRAHAFGGFRTIALTERRGSPQHGAKSQLRTFTYRVLGDVSVREQVAIQGSDGTVRTTRWDHELKALRGVTMLRLRARTTALTVAGTTSQRASIRYDYATDADLCPSRRTWRTLAGPAASRTTTLTYAAPAKLDRALACLEATRTIATAHATSALDSTEQVRIAYSDRGQPLAVSAVAGATALALRAATYGPDGNPATTTVNGEGTTRLAYVPLRRAGKRADLALPATIELPDGRTLTLAYDPVTDAATALSASRLDPKLGRLISRADRTYDDLGRVTSQVAETMPTQTFVYREPTNSALGARWTSTVIIDPGVPVSAGTRRPERQELTLYDAHGDVVAELRALAPAGANGKTRWTITSATIDDDDHDQVVTVAGGELELAEREIPAPWQLQRASNNVRLRARDRAPSALATVEIEHAPSASGDVRWTTTAALEPGGLLAITRGDGAARRTIQRYDGGGRLVSITAETGATRTADHDAQGRLRRLHLPGGGEVAVDYDAWGRPVSARKDDVTVRTSYLPGQLLVDCLTTTSATTATAGAPKQLKECYRWTAIGQPAQRLSYTNGTLDDVVRWTYAPGLVGPVAIDGRGYLKRYVVDGVEGFGPRRTAITTTIYPLPEPVANPPKHDPAQRFIAYEGSHYRSDGSIYATDAALYRNEHKLLGTDLTCRDVRDAAGWTERWSCDRFSIQKQRKPYATDYVLSTGRLVRVSHSDGLRGWDTLEVSKAGVPLWKLTAARGADGLTVGHIFTHGATGFMSGVTRDPDGAVRAVDRLVNGKAVRTEAYDYDAAGLLAAALVADKPAPIARTPRAITLAGGTWTLDPLGRMTDADGARLTWNGRSQLVSATRGGRTAGYVHDEAGQRLLRAETSAGRTTWTFSHGDWRVTADAAAGPLQVQFRRPLRLDGHTFAMLTEAGVEDADYDMNDTLIGYRAKPAYPDGLFGQRAAPITDVPSFAGGYFDDLLGSYRFGQRDYLPALGQFTTRDPSYARAPSLRADPRASNLYSYARANPLDYRDPTGLEDCQTLQEGCGGGAGGGQPTPPPEPERGSPEDIAKLCAEYGGCGDPIEVDGTAPTPPDLGHHGSDDECAPSAGAGRPDGGLGPGGTYERTSRFQSVTLTTPVVVYYSAEVKASLEALTFSRGAAAVGGWVGSLTIVGILMFYDSQTQSLANNMYKVFTNPSTPVPRR